MLLWCLFVFFFFKQKTAYEMRISDWSSDVCSSDLIKAQTRVEPGKAYTIDEALKIVQGNSKAKFVEAVDVAVRLGVDAKKSDQQVRGSTVLPAGTGKSVRVAVFAPAGAKAEEARGAGAEAVGMAENGRAHVGTPVNNAQLVGRLLR